VKIPPPLLDGSDYDVIIRNTARLLKAGWTLAEARPVVLARAGVRRVPSRPARPPQAPATPRGVGLFVGMDSVAELEKLRDAIKADRDRHLTNGKDRYR
jgi:hypothetical protein